MSKEGQSAPEGGKSATSGANDETKTVETNAYPKEFVEKLKKEKDNYKAKSEDLEKRISSELETKLKEKEEFKKLFELKTQEADKLKTEKEALEKQIKSGTVNSAVRRELVKLGFDESHTDDFFKLLGDQLNQVAIDPDTLSVIGAEELAKNAYQKYSGLGFFRKATAQVNHTSSKNIEQVTPDLSKMSTAELVEYWKKIKK